MELKILLLYLFVVNQISGCQSAILRSIRVIGNTVPEKGHDLGIQCEIFDFKSSNVASLYTTQDENLSDFNKPLTNCTRLGCVPSVVLNRYSFIASESGILINIKELVRETDQRWWHCKVDGQKERLNLIIYTTPTEIEKFGSDYGAHDLSREPVSLSCRTPCMYPQADVDWYYSKTGGGKNKYYIGSKVISEACEAMEQRQLFTLKLEINTTLSDNFESSVKFRCGMSSFPGLVGTLYSPFFDDIIFAVVVKTVVLYDEEKTILPADTIVALEGKEKTLECRPGISRPPSEILFYMGNTVVQRSKDTKFLFVAKATDYNKTISCRAYNLQAESAAVESFLATLVVRVKPKSPESPSFSELAARSVKILWIPGEDGGIEQTIHVQYKSGTETEWITENILASRGQTHLVVDSLSPGTLYQFRLYASNEIGNSRNTHSTYFATPCEDQTPEEPTKTPAWAWVFVSFFIVETIVIIGVIVKKCRN